MLLLSVVGNCIFMYDVMEIFTLYFINKNKNNLYMKGCYLFCNC